MPAPHPTTDTPPESLRTPRLIALGAALVVLALLYAAFAARTQPAQLLPAPTGPSVAAPQGATRARVVLAGGCFWGVQAVFQHTRGVLNAVSGYTGGAPDHANYPAVSSGSTSHAEAVQVTYDPQQITLGEILQVFFSVAHNPTERNRQGPDMGPQYRSAVFYTDDVQRNLTQAYIAQLDAAAVLGAPIATEVVPFTAFYRAEPGHQDYATNNPYTLYVATYDVPKLRNLQTLLPRRYRDVPVLTDAVDTIE